MNVLADEKLEWSSFAHAHESHFTLPEVADFLKLPRDTVRALQIDFPAVWASAILPIEDQRWHDRIVERSVSVTKAPEDEWINIRKTAERYTLVPNDDSSFELWSFFLPDAMSGPPRIVSFLPDAFLGVWFRTRRCVPRRDECVRVTCEEKKHDCEMIHCEEPGAAGGEYFRCRCG